jgi:hypothetical protein
MAAALVGGLLVPALPAASAAAVEPSAATSRELPTAEGSNAQAPSRNAPTSPSAAGGPPTVLSVAPNALAPGQSATLTLTGTNLQPTMTVDFGPGIVVERAPSVTDPAHAQATVLVTPGTPAGRHLVTVTYVPHATLAALPAVRTQGPGYVDVVLPGSAGPVELEELSPREVKQGEAATLQLRGSGFTAGMALSFGPGITAMGQVAVAGPGQATLAIQVSPQAPTLLRHPTLLVAGRDVHVSPEATLTVAAAAPVVVPQPVPVALQGGNLPVILAITPARLFTGQSYTVSLRGINLVPQMKVDLGAGVVATGGLRLQSPSAATLDVSVDGGAQPGIRWVGLEVPSALVSLRQDASVFVQRSLVAPRQVVGPRPSECKPPRVAHQGTIVLDGPLFTGYLSDTGGTYNIPVLNDQTTLSWHEANPGLADRFEVRFYAGNTLVATQPITAAPGYALPHSLAPSDALIAQLTNGVPGRATKIVNQHPGPGTPAPAVGWDLAWQVAGLRTYYDSCISPAAIRGSGGGMLIGKQALGPGKELEVEHSEVVPIKEPQTGDPLLDLPAAPTGLSCSAPPVHPRMRGTPAPAPPPWQNPTLTLSNTSLTTQANNRVQTANYVGDQWQFSGTLDLSGAPWALESQQSVTNQPKQPLESESLNNVFIDWGDGSVEPLDVQWNGQYCGGSPCFASNTETSNASVFDLNGASNAAAFGHAYAEVGSFNVRVFMLPAAAVQQQGALPMSVKAGSGGLYGRLLTRAGQLQQGGASSSDLAYMPFCQTVEIQPRTDPVSNGPLQLMGIAVSGFPGDGTGGVHHVIDRGPRDAGAAPAVSHRVAAAPVRVAPGTLAGAGAGAGTGATGAQSLPQFSSCDVDLVGGAVLSFEGQGTAKVTWYVDGSAVGSSLEAIGPSPSRSQQQLAPPNPAAPLVGSWGGLHSPPLALAQAAIGQHEISVTAEVVEDAFPTGRVLGALASYATGASTGVTRGNGALSSAPPLGLLGPRLATPSGLPPIQWVNQAPAGAPGIGLRAGIGAGEVVGARQPGGDPPNDVVSTPTAYEVTSADPKLPCTFNFPVKGGTFTVAGLQHGGKATVTQQNGHYSGTGVLQAEFADSTGTSTQPEPVTVHLQGWTMQGDGVTVASGNFDESPSLAAMHVPGLTASLGRITGTAGQQVTATLTATLANTDILATSGSAPPPWKNVSATLSPTGDWYADQLPLPGLLVYDSGFILSAASVTFDLSASEGSGVDPLCVGSGGKGWMGVALNQAKLTAFNFNLPNPPAAGATGWALDSYGFCGQASFASATATIDRGTIGWSGISATAAQGAFTAGYSGLKVHVPWLNADFSSPQATTLLTAGRNVGEGGITLNLTSPSTVTLTEGPITLTASNLSFGSVKNAGGWAVRSDTTLAFKAEQGQFAGGIVLHGLDYGMNGAAVFADGTTSRHIALTGQKGSIGGSLVDLKSVDVTVGAAASPSRLSFGFDTTLNLSKTLPAADVSVSYGISEPSTGSYQGTGPVTSPFKIDKPFPDANPSVHLSMTPSYVGSGSGSKSGSGVLFSSNLDLGMFGGPPVSGQFVLGYVGSDDYWLGRAILDLGPTGIVLVPLALNLYQVGGGLGYNVAISSFKSADLTQATPQDDGTLVFDATLLVGSPDHTTFGLLGDFVIKPGGQDPGGRMDYHAWLLNPVWSGTSPIYGYFGYSGGNFDGTLNAHFSVLDDQIALDAINDAIHMHIGGGSWYFHIGTQPNPVSGHVFAFNGQAWADVGSDGFGLGLVARMDVKAGDCGGACAYINDDWSLAASITPSPLSFAASAGENFDLGACADGFCLSANASASMTMSLPPPSLNFSFGLGSCPPGQISVGLEVLPSLHGNVGGSVCW